MPTIGERLRIVRLATFAGLLLLRATFHFVEALHHLGVLFFGREVALEGDEDHPGGAAAAAFGLPCAAAPRRRRGGSLYARRDGRARRPEAVQRSSAVGLPPRGRARRESAGTEAVLPWESTRLEHTSTVHVPGVPSLVASPKALLSVGSEAQASRSSRAQRRVAATQTQDSRVSRIVGTAWTRYRTHKGIYSQAPPPQLSRDLLDLRERRLAPGLLRRGAAPQHGDCSQ